MLTATGAECSLNPPPSPACGSESPAITTARQPDHPPEGEHPAPATHPAVRNPPPGVSDSHARRGPGVTKHGIKRSTAELGHPRPPPSNRKQPQPTKRDRQLEPPPQRCLVGVVGEVGAQPALDLGQRQAAPARVVGDL